MELTQHSGDMEGIVQSTFWNGHPSSPLKKEMLDLVNEFNATHPNIRVT